MELGDLAEGAQAVKAGSRMSVRCLTPKLLLHQPPGPQREEPRGEPQQGREPLLVTGEETHGSRHSPHWPWGLTGTVYSRL